MDENQLKRVLARTQKELKEARKQLRNWQKKSETSSRMLAEKIDELVMSHHILSSTRQTMNLEDRLEIILKGVTIGVGFDRAIILLVDEKEKVLTDGMGSEGIPWKRIQAIRVPLTKEGGILAQAVLKKRTYHIKNASKAEDLNPEILGALKARSFVVTPLVTGGSVVGIIWADNSDSGRPIKKEAIGSLIFLANQAALAIRNIQLYINLEEANKELVRLSNIKSEFVSTVSHELRTPLTSIKEGVLLVLDQTAGKINDTQKRCLTIAQQEVDRLARIINNLLDISRIEAGKVELKKRWVNIAELSKEVLTSLQSQAKDKGIHLRFEPPTDLPKMYIDPDRIKEVFINLLGNALKFTLRRGKITLRIEDKKDEVEVSVSDTGPGIPADQMDKIFDKFHQVEGASFSGTGGTGLGLPIAQKIIEMHQGRIWVKSRLGRGSRFIFTLPKDSQRTKARRQKRGGNI